SARGSACDSRKLNGAWPVANLILATGRQHARRPPVTASDKMRLSNQLLFQLLRQSIIGLDRGGVHERALVPPGRERGPQQQVGAEDRDEQGSAGEIKSIADDLPRAEERRLRFEPNEAQAEGFPGGGVGDQAGRRPQRQRPREGLDVPYAS